MRAEQNDMSDLTFTKGQALGNDYLVVEADALDAPLDAARVRALCDRHRGAGSDGVLLRLPGERPFRLRIYNPDGTEAEKSGNGLRIFAAYLHGRGLVGSEPFVVELATDTVKMQVLGSTPHGELDVLAAMGRASFDGRSVGFVPVTGDVREHDLDLGDGLAARVVPVSMGNPHCVVFVEQLERADFLARAPRLATHSAFRAGTNVQFARVAGGDRLEAWIWERGAGETLASGSSACAVAAAARHLGRVAADRVTVAMPGGEVAIEFGAEGMVHLRGPAQIVYEGVVAEAVWARWGFRS